MADSVVLFEGGFPTSQLPAHDAFKTWGCPLPKQIAGEYDRGYFTLGNIFQPAAIPHQAAAMKRLKPTDVPADLAMIVIPEKHSHTELFLQVDPIAPMPITGRYGPVVNTMAGVTFDVWAKVVDTAACETAKTMEELIGSGTDVEVPAEFKGIDASQHKVVHAFLADDQRKFIEEGKVLVYGIRLLSAPTGQDIKFEDLAGRIALVAKASNFEFPWQF